MDLGFLMDYVNLVTLGICLCVGFALKYAKLFEWMGNQYIPLLMLLLGTAINLMANWPDISSGIILEGMISGLASTGFYEMLRNMLRKDGKKKEEGCKKFCSESGGKYYGNKRDRRIWMAGAY